MSFEDLESGRNLRSIHPTPQQQDPSRALVAVLFKINTSVSAFQRQVNALETSKDTSLFRSNLLLCCLFPFDAEAIAALQAMLCAKDHNFEFVLFEGDVFNVILAANGLDDFFGMARCLMLNAEAIAALQAMLWAKDHNFEFLLFEAKTIPCKGPAPPENRTRPVCSRSTKPKPAPVRLKEASTFSLSHPSLGGCQREV